MQATFDEHAWCVTPGWATYLPMRRFRVRCWLGRHIWPTRLPDPLNGHSPSNYDCCARCGAAMHWYVEGQHQHGGVNRYFAGL